MTNSFQDKSVSKGNNNTGKRVICTLLAILLCIILIALIIIQNSEDTPTADKDINLSPFFHYLTNIVTLYTFDKLFLIPSVVCVMIVLLFISYSLFPHTEEHLYLWNYKLSFEESYRKKDIWLNSSIAWQIFYYWLFGSSLLSTLNVIYISLYDSITVTLENQLRRIVFYSVISILFSMLNTFISPNKISSGYREAYEIIDAGIIEGYHTENIQTLTRARILAEKKIGNGFHSSNI